jgi:hypothetical protein
MQPFISLSDAAHRLADRDPACVGPWLQLLLAAEARGDLHLVRFNTGGSMPGGVQPYGHDAGSFIHTADLQRWAKAHGYSLADDGKSARRDDVVKRWLRTHGDRAAKQALAAELLATFGTREAAAKAAGISRPAFSKALPKADEPAPVWPAGIDKATRQR